MCQSQCHHAVDLSTEGRHWGLCGAVDALQVPDVNQFMAQYNMQCPMAAQRLLHSGIPATYEHGKPQCAPPPPLRSIPPIHLEEAVAWRAFVSLAVYVYTILLVQRGGRVTGQCSERCVHRAVLHHNNGHTEAQHDSRGPGTILSATHTHTQFFLSSPRSCESTDCVKIQPQIRRHAQGGLFVHASSGVRLNAGVSAAQRPGPEFAQGAAQGGMCLP
jgi:hypothetical protein